MARTTREGDAMPELGIGGNNHGFPLSRMTRRYDSQPLLFLSIVSSTGAAGDSARTLASVMGCATLASFLTRSVRIVTQTWPATLTRPGMPPSHEQSLFFLPFLIYRLHMTAPCRHTKRGLEVWAGGTRAFGREDCMDDSIRIDGYPLLIRMSCSLPNPSFSS